MPTAEKDKSKRPEIIKARVLAEANFMIENNATLRQVADKFNRPLSVVHDDLTVKLLKIDPILHAQVKIIIDKNTAERPKRAGEGKARSSKQSKVDEGERTI